MLILAGIFYKTRDNYLPGATNEMQIGSVVPCSQVFEQVYPKINNGAEACMSVGELLFDISCGVEEQEEPKAYDLLPTLYIAVISSGDHNNQNTFPAIFCCTSCFIHVEMFNTLSIPLLLVLMTMIATIGAELRTVKHPHIFSESGEACEHSGEALAIDCSPHVIKITHAAYGVYSNDNTCGRSYSGTCESAISLEVMRARCDGKESCNTYAANNLFGDPCPMTLKYLTASWYCQDHYN
eukprot:sb/3469134/